MMMTPEDEDEGVVVITVSTLQEDTNIVDAHEYVPCCRICCTNIFNMNRINEENCIRCCNNCSSNCNNCCNCCNSCMDNWIKCGYIYDKKCINYLKLNCGEEYVNNCCGCCYRDNSCCYKITFLTIIIISTFAILSGIISGAIYGIML